MGEARRKKIGVIMPAITESLDASFLEGIYKQMSACGYDVIVFTCSANMQQELVPTAYAIAEESIYRLVSRTDLDGLIFAAGKFHDERAAERILNSLHGIRFPCVCTYYGNDLFPNVEVPQGEGIRRITAHLIEEHGFTRIFCLTGPQGFPEAEERLAGWRIAMEQAGLPADQYRYGDFWFHSPRELAADIAAKKIPVPEAVVCANDFMAIALCRRLAEYGIRVPEDIAVTGFDGGPNSTLTSPSLTTVEGKEFDVGSNAAIALLQLMDGQERRPVYTQHITFGRSCGCKEKSPEEYFAMINEKYILANAYRDSRIMKDYINRMASSESLKQLSDRIAELSIILPYWNDLYVCVRDDMISPDSAAVEQELPGQMHLFVSIHQAEQRNAMTSFPIQEFLPDDVCGAASKRMIAVPLHNTETIFGYIVTTYSNSRHYIFDDLYFSWRDSVANALSVQYIKMQNRRLTQRLEKFSERDRMTGMLNLKGLSRKLQSGQRYACITLMIRWQRTASFNVSMDPELFVANAVQMSCRETELCFRYNKDVFGILLSLPDKMDPERACEEWILRFHALVDYMCQRDKQLGKPVISTFCDVLQEQTEELPRMLEQLITGHLLEDQLVPTIGGSLSQQLEEIRRQIIREPSGDWTLAGIAAAMQISESYFRRLYKQQFGIPFHTDLIHLRMSRAMKLLRETDMNIKLIAEQCGYDNVYHFMTAFKKETGLTATEFRSAKQRKE